MGTEEASRTQARTAVYPGTFDPLTFGHLDLIRRGASLFDRLIVAVAVNTGKDPLFTMEERAEHVRAEIADVPNAMVDAFDGLIVDYVKRVGSRVILRGIRTLTDFEYEFGMALTNRSFAREVETLFIMPSIEWTFTSSRLMKEALSKGADISPFVPRRIYEAMKQKLCKR